jgi:hypothetical protein
MDYTINKTKQGYVMMQLFNGRDGRIIDYKSEISIEDMSLLIELIAPKVKICVGRYLEIQKTWLLERLGTICLINRGIVFTNHNGVPVDVLYRSLFQGGVFRHLLWQYYWRPLKVLEYQKVITANKNRVIVDVHKFKVKYMG